MVEPQKALSQEEMERNAEIADGLADSTKDGGKRGTGWKPLLVSKEDYEAENPYK
jgi:hypothetical protein